MKWVWGMIKEIWNFGLLGRCILLHTALLLVVIPITIMRSIDEERNWQVFLVEHDCKVVGRVSGSMNFGMTANGKAGPILNNQSTPRKAGYLCADGVTYWR